ncbi:DsbA family oxidoreductase [Actinomadura chibensis]|uniref:DsbA family oxidoreductase n=1 Tax=Actinomadura chibensis TaxID=392828 RepID=UPI000A4D30A0|nr:DsbA family oxidoreductase [Actinomadura chibensis]
MRIDVYADVLCPWCYIGKRRLAAALDGLAGPEPVDVRWRAYELGPDLPRVPGRSAAAQMADPSWWGAEAPSRIDRIRALGAAEGLTLDLHRARPVNTFDAHRLIRFGHERGLGDATAERLLLAYHSEGANVADHGVLERLGTEAGLDDAEVRAVLAGDAHAADVRADERRAARSGVTGVPSLVIDGGRPVPGVQPAHVLRRLLSDAPPAASRP